MSLDALQFADARASELHAVSALLQPADPPAGAKRRPARQEKRLLRRRTGSATAWRWRTRLPLSRDLLSLVRGRSRRDRRRAADLRARALARGGLETERWHAKRFRMHSAWGLRVPCRSNDRAEAAAVRAARQTSVVHDASYLRCVRLRGDAALLRSLLEHTTDEGLAVGGKLRLGREVACTLHHVDAWPAGAIAPVRLVPADAACSDVRLFAHHAAAQVVVAALEHAAALASEAAAAGAAPSAGVEVRLCVPPLVRLQVRGEQSTALLRRALRMAPRAAAAADDDDDDDDEGAAGSSDVPSARAWEAIGAMPSPASLPPRCVLGVEVLRPSTAKPPAKPPPLCGGEAPCEARDERELRRLLCSWPPSLAKTRVWRLADEGDDAAAPSRRAVREGCDAPLPLLLVQEPPSSACAAGGAGGVRGGFGCGWDIIAPAGSGSAVWQALILAGGRAVGLSDVRAISLQAGLPLFPYDAPDTFAGLRQEATDAAARREHFARRPPSRRPSFAALRVEQPFAADWLALLGLAGAQQADGDGMRPLQFCVLRGAPVALAFRKPAPPRRGGGAHDASPAVAPVPALPPMLRAILPRCLLCVSLTLQRGGRVRPPAAIHEASSEVLDIWIASASWRGVDLPKSAKAASPTSELLGYVTNGGYSVLQGYSVALGFCAASLLEPLLLGKSNTTGTVAGPVRVLVRNVSSRRYWPALLTVSA